MGDADDHRRATGGGERAIEEPAAVAEPVAARRRSQHRQQHRVGLHLAARRPGRECRTRRASSRTSRVPLPEDERRTSARRPPAARSPRRGRAGAGRGSARRTRSCTASRTRARHARGSGTRARGGGRSIVAARRVCRPWSATRAFMRRVSRCTAPGFQARRASWGCGAWCNSRGSVQARVLFFMCYVKYGRPNMVAAHVTNPQPCASLRRQSLGATAAHGQGRLHARPGRRFLAAREAYAKGNAAAARDARAARCSGHILEPYVEYWQLRLRLEQAAPGEVSDFLEPLRPARSSPSNLRREWLKLLGKRQQWDALRRRVPEPRERRSGRHLLQPAVPLAPRRRGGRGGVPPRVGERARAARGLRADRRERDRGRQAHHAPRVGARAPPPRGGAGRRREARASTICRRNEQPEDRTLDAIRAQPAKFIERADKLDLKRRANRELLLVCVRAAGARRGTVAASLLDEEAPGAAPARGPGVGVGPARHARRAEPRRRARSSGSRNANGTALTDEQLEWRVRAALRASDWPDVRAAIEQMTPLTRNDPAWTYWQGRRLRGDRGEARAPTQFFAASRASTTSTASSRSRSSAGRSRVPPRGYEPTPEDVKEAAANPGLQRAVALFRIDTSGLRDGVAREVRFDAVREWNWSLRGMDDRAAARGGGVRADARAVGSRDQHRRSHRGPARFPAALSRAVPRRVRRAGARAGARGVLGARPRPAGEPLHRGRPLVGRRLRPDAADAGDRALGREEDRHARLHAGAGDRASRSTSRSARRTCATCSTSSTAARCSRRRPTTPARAGRAVEGRPAARRRDLRRDRSRSTRRATT